MDIVENNHIWSIIKDGKPNYIFTKKRKYIDWNENNDPATLSQMAHLDFCTKVFLDTYK